MGSHINVPAAAARLVSPAEVSPLSGISDQIAIVTGANSGVGKSAAEQLARAGAHVIMVCRDRGRGELALADLRAPAPRGRLELELADLSRQADVRELSRRLVDRLDRVDILVNNAGVWQNKRVMSTDGFELTFAINHLGHFLLTNLLLDRLRAGRGRIVNVSSEAHRRGDLRRASLDEIVRGSVWRGGIQAYGDTKLANILFTFESVRRWGKKGLTANAVHPGVLATRIWNRNWSPISLMMRPMKLVMSKPDVGGSAVMRLVEDPDRDEVTGRYFKIEKEVAPEAPANDEALAAELWDRSLEWTGAS